jgi:hypothetical protein
VLHDRFSLMPGNARRSYGNAMLGSRGGKYLQWVPPSGPGSFIMIRGTRPVVPPRSRDDATYAEMRVTSCPMQAQQPEGQHHRSVRTKRHKVIN